MAGHNQGESAMKLIRLVFVRLLDFFVG